jgi:8-amino-7-oxononanoate synthase
MQDRLIDAARVRDRRGTVRATRISPGTDEDAGTGALDRPLDLASNDYLGLSTDSRLKAAAITATERYGTGARASRVVTGTLPIHNHLEQSLAELTGQPAALAFSSGYAANLGILTALGGPDTLILIDAHIHASLVDAARLSRSPVTTIPHSNFAALNDLLANRTQTRAIVVIESIYSVLGDAPNLLDAAMLCATHDALLVVDEAHGVGVLGAGRGGVYAAGSPKRWERRAAPCSDRKCCGTTSSTPPAVLFSTPDSPRRQRPLRLLHVASSSPSQPEWMRFIASRA